jgi:hypothetical protein
MPDHLPDDPSRSAHTGRLFSIEVDATEAGFPLKTPRRPLLPPPFTQPWRAWRQRALQ